MSMWRVEKGKLPFPVAVVLHGSVVKRIVWGLTRAHAVRRGRKWMLRNPAPTTKEQQP